MQDNTSAIKIDPEYAQVFFARGFSLMRLDRYSEAIWDITEGLRLDPAAHYLWYNNRAICYAKTGQTNEAAADFRRFLELAGPTDKERTDVVNWLKRNGFN